MTPAQRTAEARKVLELARRHHVAMEYTAEHGWRLVPVDVDELLAAAPPFADELRVVS